MTEGRLSLGINLGILLSLTIFGVLLSLPLRLLLNTNYSTQNGTNNGNEVEGNYMNSDGKHNQSIRRIDYRKIKRCPNLEYEDRIMSILVSNYDRNCTLMQIVLKTNRSDNVVPGFPNKYKLRTGRNRGAKGPPKEVTEEMRKANRMKSIPIAGQILVAMLVVYSIAAFVEVIRIHLATDKDSTKPRRTSIVDLVQRRHQTGGPTINQRYSESNGVSLNRLNPLGASPLSHSRRHSLPAGSNDRYNYNNSLMNGSYSSGLSRRPSVEYGESIYIPKTGTHAHRVRMIRRY